MKSEKQYPIKLALGLIIVSSLIFTTVTFSFGWRVNSVTGEVEINTVLDNQCVDAWSYDPMVEVWGGFWQYYALAGFFGSLMMFVYCLFQLDADIAEEELEKIVQKRLKEITQEKNT